MNNRFLSMGWGLQSTTIAVMAALGDIPPITAAIHATTPEREATRSYIAFLTPWLADRGLQVINAPSVPTAAIVNPATVQIPAYTGGNGQLNRQCTRDWKIRPFRRVVRSIIGRSRKARAVALLGISLDEFDRAKNSDVQYLSHEFPLLDLGMTRQECADYLQGKGLPVPPKSSCVFCPYHSKSAWEQIRSNPHDWQIATEYDHAIRDLAKGIPVYVHPSKQPLAMAIKAPGETGYQENFLDHIEQDAPCKSGYCWS